MRLFVSTIATAAIFLAATAASAVEFSLASDSVSVNPGESFTIDIIMTNTSLTAVQSLGASAYTYDGVATFDSGQAVVNYFNQVCLGPATCFGGLENLVGGAPLAESSIGANGNRVQIALSAALSAVSNPGAGVDPGLDGVVGSTMFSLTFTAVSSGVISIGTGYEGDGIVLPDGSAIQAATQSFTVNVIPEPGTALLMGLGLVGLATAGRQRD